MAVTTILAMLTCVVAVQASPPAAPRPDATPQGSTATAPPQPAPPAPALADADYRIGVDDALSIAVLQAPELNASARVSNAGEITMPLLGAVRAAGLTVNELQIEIERQLRERYIRNPDVTVQVGEVRSHGVSVIGSVRRPGTVQVGNDTTLLEVLSLAGGLAEDAGESVIVLRPARGDDGSARAVTNGLPAGDVIQINLKRLLEASDASLNMPIRPGDVVNVQAASVVYVVGAVKRPGAFATRGNDRLTVLRAIALGEGLAPVADRGGALVVRTNERGEREEIAVDLGAILEGKAADIPLEAQDVVFVPTSGGKVVTRATLEALVRIVTFRPW